MNSVFTEDQRSKMNEILRDIWGFMKSLNADQIKTYSNHFPEQIAELAEDMGVQEFIKVMHESEVNGCYNPRISNFVVNPSRTRFYSYDDTFELFAILRIFR